MLKFDIASQFRAHASRIFASVEPGAAKARLTGTVQINYANYEISWEGNKPNVGFKIYQNLFKYERFEQTGERLEHQRETKDFIVAELGKFMTQEQHNINFFQAARTARAIITPPPKLVYPLGLLPASPYGQTLPLQVEPPKRQ